MQKYGITLLGAALIALATPAAAQDGAEDQQQDQQTPAAPATDEGLAMGRKPGDQAGQTYTKDSFKDWDMRCAKAEDGRDPCQLYQLVEDDNGNSVAEISIFPLPEGQKAVAGGTIVTPLETLLTRQLTVSVDGGQGKQYPFRWCSEVGCFARVGFTADDISRFKGGLEVTITISPVVAPDQPVDLSVSLSGFTAGYDAVKAYDQPSADSGN